VSTTSETSAADNVEATPPAPQTSATPQPPAAGEAIHLPGPTIIPLITAAAITLIVIGTTIWWVYSAIGAVVLVLAIIRWVMDTRRDVSELPEEHEQH
jgi:Flp pilus assembly protein TadB